LEARNLPSAYTPAQIVPAYGFNQVSFNGAPGDGRGETIAIVDAYNSPNIQKDVSVFSSQFKLPQLDGANGDPTLTVRDLSNPRRFRWEG
jgi:subtilase family serine protease